MPRSETYDALIVGAGPAGLAVAHTLARHGVTSLLLERQSGVEVRVGESVGPELKPLLARLDLEALYDDPRHRLSTEQCSAWTSEQLDVSSSIVNPHGPGRQLTRQHFDRELVAQLLSRGGELAFDATVRTLRQGPERWNVEIQIAKTRSQVQARWLVDTSGTASVARRLRLRNVTLDRLLGISALLEPKQERAESLGGLASSATLFIEAHERGYWYSAPLADGRLACAFLSDADLLPDNDLERVWQESLLAAPHTRARLALFHPPGGFSAQSCSSRHLQGPFPPRFIAAGDALMRWDPLSSRGIEKALSSGISAAETVLARSSAAHAVNEYLAQQLQSFEQYRRRRGSYYRLVSRWPHATFWLRRRAMSNSEVWLDPDAMLTLGSGQFRAEYCRCAAAAIGVAETALAALCEPMLQATPAQTLGQFLAERGASPLAAIQALQYLLEAGVLRETSKAIL